MPPNSARTPGQGFKTYQKLLTNWYLAIHIAKNIVCMYLQHSTRKPAHTRFREFRVIIFFIFFLFSKPAISILERVDAVIFVQNISRVGRGVHSPQVIVSCSMSLHYHRGTLHGRQRMTPFSVNLECIMAGVIVTSHSLYSQSFMPG